MQDLFCASVLRVTSWGSLQASSRRSQRLSANTAPFNPHRSTQMFPQMIMDQPDSHTHAYMYWDLTKAARSIHITQKIMFLQSCNALSCEGGGDAFLYLMCSITSLFYFNLSLYVFRRGEAVLSVPGQELHAPNVCLHQCVSACFL